MSEPKRAAQASPTYNISGAASALGRASSTILSAIARGDLTSTDGPIGADGERSTVIRAQALASYRDLLASRLELNKDAESKAEAKRLRALVFP